MQRPANYVIPKPQGGVESDVFDTAGIYVPTPVSATLQLLLVNCMQFFESVDLCMHQNMCYCKQ